MRLYRCDRNAIDTFGERKKNSKIDCITYSLCFCLCLCLGSAWFCFALLGSAFAWSNLFVMHFSTICFCFCTMDFSLYFVSICHSIFYLTFGTRSQRQWKHTTQKKERVFWKTIQLNADRLAYCQSNGSVSKRMAKRFNVRIIFYSFRPGECLCVCCV